MEHEEDLGACAGISFLDAPPAVKIGFKLPPMGGSFMSSRTDVFR